MSKEIAPGIVVEKIPFPKPVEFDFSVMAPGESFSVTAGGGKTAKQNRDRLLGLASSWARQSEADVHFRSSEKPDGTYRIHCEAGKRAYASKRHKANW